MIPQFTSMAALRIEQGGIYAVANMRGGGEFGEEIVRDTFPDKIKPFVAFYLQFLYVFRHT